MNKQEATELAREILAHILLSEKEKLKHLQIHLWTTAGSRTIGIRISEVSYFDGRHGWSYMSSDLPKGLAVCATVERLILELMDGEEEEVRRYTEDIRFLTQEMAE